MQQNTKPAFVFDVLIIYAILYHIPAGFNLRSDSTLPFFVDGIAFVVDCFYTFLPVG